MKEHGVIAIIKKHVLTAIGYMIPLVVAAGLCMALGQFIDGDVRNSTSASAICSDVNLCSVPIVPWVSTTHSWPLAFAPFINFSLAI